jgi:predicted membrane chloride channel (bestrophin family)
MLWCDDGCRPQHHQLLMHHLSAVLGSRFIMPPRWNEARRFWGLLINRSRDIARQALQWAPPDQDAAVAAAICRWTAAFPLVLMCSLREDVQLEPSLTGVRGLWMMASRRHTQ